MSPLSRRRFFPNELQLPFLRACLLRDPAAARRSWQVWKERVNLDDLDEPCFRLMSLAYRRMVELGIDDPDAMRIKGLYRYHWTRNQLAWRGKDGVLRELHSLGIPTLLLKGAALSRTIYRDPTSRGMHDLDVLVPIADAAAAMTLLEERGWIAQHFDAPRTIAYFHGCSFLHPEFGELDLHWHVMRSCCRTERDAELWAAAPDLKVNGVPTRVLCPADMFLHACEHGMHPSPASALQWLVDATVIIQNSGPAFDWRRLIDQARKFRLVLMVRRTLRFIRDNFEPSVPGDILRELDRTPVGLLERAAYFLAGRPHAAKSLRHRLSVAACHYLRLKEGSPLREKIREFPLYYRLLTHERLEWGQRYWQLARDLVLKSCADLQALVFRTAVLLRHGSLVHGGLVTRMPVPALHHFYKAEWEYGSPFRWSETEAHLELQLPRAPQVVRFGFRNARNLRGLLDDGLAFRINGHALPPAALRFSVGGRFLHLKLEPGMLAPTGPQRLSWTIRPWPAAPDPRRLGLPLSRVWTYRVGRHARA